MIYLAALILGVFFNVAAQILLKSSAQQVAVLEKWGLLTGSLLFYGAGFFLYAFSLTKLELSRAYPVSATLAIILVALFSPLLFNEQITAVKVTGLLLCSFGIFLLFK